MSKWRDEKQRYKQYQGPQGAALRELPRGDRRSGEVRTPVRPGHRRHRGDDARGPRRDLEQDTQEGTPVREIVGDDPVQFTQDPLESYPANPWVAKEQQRLARSMNHAARTEV